MAARVHENMSSWQSQCPQGRRTDSLFSPSLARWVCHVGPLRYPSRPYHLRSAAKMLSYVGVLLTHAPSAASRS